MGYMIFIINALMYSFSIQQNTVEASTYGSELVAMIQVRDKIVELRIRCKSIGLRLVGPSEVLYDNQSMIKNTSIPEFIPLRKQNAVNYHIVREVDAAVIMKVGKEDTETNPADALTKLMPYTKKRCLIRNMSFDY